MVGGGAQRECSRHAAWEWPLAMRAPRIPCCSSNEETSSPRATAGPDVQMAQKPIARKSQLCLSPEVVRRNDTAFSGTKEVGTVSHEQRRNRETRCARCRCRCRSVDAGRCRRSVPVGARSGAGSGLSAGLKNMSSGRLTPGGNGRRRLHFLHSKFSSVELRSTDVTLFT